MDVGRVDRLIAQNPSIVETLFTRRELAYCAGRRRRVEHLAARFAGKEAVLKALGTGLGQRMQWTDVEIVNELSGRPSVELYGAVAAWAEQQGVQSMDVSLSHTRQFVVAHAVAVLARAPGEAGLPTPT